MTEERKKILEMVRDGIITIEEGEELLRVLENSKTAEEKPGAKFKNTIKEDLQKTKEELLKAKEKLMAEYEKINMEKVKDKIKKGIDKVDKAVGKMDEAILKYGEKIIKKDIFVDDEDEDDDNEPLDPMEDENISFYDKKEK